MNRAFIPISLLFGVGAILFIWAGEPGNVSVLTSEDGAVENLSVIFYMTAFIVSALSGLRNERMVFPIIWAVLCLLFIGEETSWFQRLFHYSIPSVERVNAQNEFNLHNLSVFHASSMMDSPVGASMLLKSQNLFRIGFFGFFLILPLLLHVPRVRLFMSKIGYKKPDAGFVLVLILVFALSFFLAFYSPATARDALAETREMLYAFFIMMYVIAYLLPDTYESPALRGNNKQ